MFAHLFGIREWEMDLLTHAGFQGYVKFADDWMRARASRGE